MKKIYFINIYILLIFNTIHAQKFIHGHVYSAITNAPIVNAKIESSSGKTATSCIDGSYSIAVFLTDTLWFWVQRRKSYAYPVKDILSPEAFDVSMQVGTSKIPYNFTRDMEGRLPEAVVKSIKKKKDTLLALPTADDITTLAPITVYQRNYHKDSLKNREEYAKYYNYKKPKLGDAIKIKLPFLSKDSITDYKPQNVATFVKLDFDIGTIFNAIQKKKNDNLSRLKRNLIINEQEGYVDNRFKKTTVVKYIGEQPDSTLNDFMKKCRPSYQQIVGLTELDFAMYIKNAFKEYKNKQKDSLRIK